MKIKIVPCQQKKLILHKKCISCRQDDAAPKKILS